MGGIKRNLHNKINNLLSSFPAVAIIGPRQSGKTYLSKVLRPDWKYIDLERPDTFERVNQDTSFFLEKNSDLSILYHS